MRFRDSARRFRDIVSVPFSYPRLGCETRSEEPADLSGFVGAPEEIRTPDPQIRSLVLYPAELRARFSVGLENMSRRRAP